MINFDDLIKYENESTSLDFKAIQYGKKQYRLLLRMLCLLNKLGKHPIF